MSTEVTSPTSNDSVNPPAAPVGAVPTANTMSAVVTRPTVDNGPAAACLALPRRPRIMMVDDEKLNSYVVAEYLKSDGHCDLIHVDNPLQALELATRSRPDVMLLDLHMPKLSGLKLLEQLRADTKLAHTVVVILTASTEDSERAQAMALGAAAFLQKPIHKARLLECLRSVLTSLSP